MSSARYIFVTWAKIYSAALVGVILPTAAIAKTDCPAATTASYAAAAGLRLRQQPDAKSPMVAMLLFNQQICLVSSKAEWSKISVPAETIPKEGWIQSRFISFNPLSNTEILREVDQATATMNWPLAVTWAERALESSEQSTGPVRDVILNKTYAIYLAANMPNKARAIRTIIDSKPPPNEPDERENTTWFYEKFIETSGYLHLRADAEVTLGEAERVCEMLMKENVSDLKLVEELALTVIYPRTFKERTSAGAPSKMTFENPDWHAKLGARLLDKALLGKLVNKHPTLLYSLPFPEAGYTAAELATYVIEKKLDFFKLPEKVQRAIPEKTVRENAYLLLANSESGGWLGDRYSFADEAFFLAYLKHRSTALGNALIPYRFNNWPPGADNNLRSLFNSLPSKLSSKKAIADALLKMGINIYTLLPASLKSDPDIYNRAVTLVNCSELMRANPKNRALLLKKAAVGATELHYCLDSVDPSLRSDRALFLQLLPLNPNVINKVLGPLVKDRELLLLAARLASTKGRDYGCPFYSFDLVSDHTLRLEIVKIDRDCLHRLTREDLKDPNAVKLVVSDTIPMNSLIEIIKLAPAELVTTPEVFARITAYEFNEASQAEDVLKPFQNAELILKSAKAYGVEQLLEKEFKVAEYDDDEEKPPVDFNFFKPFEKNVGFWKSLMQIAGQKNATCGAIDALIKLAFPAGSPDFIPSLMPKCKP